MPRSTQTKLSNMCNGLHNLSNTVDVDGGEYSRDDDCYEMDLYRANYLFMKQSPMYSRLDQKYKEAKKKIREQQKMIELLNRQNIEIMERYATRMNSVPHVEQTVTLSETFAKIKLEPGLNNKPVTVVDLTNNETMHVEPPVHIVIEDEDDETEEQEEEEVVLEQEAETEETEEEEEVEVEVEETEEAEEVEVEVEETEEEEEEVEVEETEEEEEVEVEVEETEVEETEVEETEVEETEEEEEVEVEVEETEEEEEVEVEETEEDEEVEVEVEETEEEEEVEVEDTEEEEEVEVEVEETEEQEEEEEGVYEVEIKGKRYYTTNDVNGTIYAVLDDDDIGDEVGKFVDGKAIFAK